MIKADEARKRTEQAIWERQHEDFVTLCKTAEKEIDFQSKRGAGFAFIEVTNYEEKDIRHFVSYMESFGYVLSDASVGCECLIKVRWG